MMYPRLFKPLKIRHVELPNRMIMAPMHMGYTPEGLVTDQFLEFYRERAKGKAGMIIVGGANFHPTGKFYRGMLSIENDDTIPGLKKLTDAIRNEGVVSAIQLLHGGRYCHSSVLGGEQAVSASAMPSLITRETPRELSTAEVEEIVDSHGQATRRALEAGFDVVEVLAGTGYLISQFLSPITNLRTDKYGGDFFGRMTFLREILAAIEKQVGQDIVVCCRISGDEFMPGGNTINEMIELVKVLAKERVDLISVCGGWHETEVPLVTAEVPPGTFAYFTRTFKEYVGLPMAISNRINHPSIAEEILSRGQADAVVMARAFLADPHIALKSKEGREDSIRPCIACNQGCLDNIFADLVKGCMVNVRTGNETEPAPEEKPLGKRILVVGAGPAGMEAARVAATRGAEVTLMERNPYLGGQFNLAGTPSNRKTFLNLIRYYKNELKRLGVEIRLGEEVTPTVSLIEEVDAVILATGGRSLKPNIPGVELPHVMTAWEVLEGNREAFGNVVIIGGGATACAAAIYISDKKKVPCDAAAYLESRGITPPEPRMKPNITVLEMLKRIGTDIGLTTRWVNLQELNLRSIRMITKVEVKSIEPKAVVYQDEKGGEHHVPADCVVLAVGVESVNSLEEPLSKKTTELHVIGDAKEPRKAMEAIREGYRTAMELV